MQGIRRVALLCTLALAAGACSTAHVEAIRVQRTNVHVLPTGSMNPLTGVVYETPQPWQNRPVLGVKIGNSSPERPQAGIDRADLIYEELVEGGETRFLAFFLTNSPDRIGPVRSCRTVDPQILAPIGGLFGYSGGVQFVVNAVRAVPNVKDVGADVKGDAYVRDSNRNMPYNLYTSATTLWRGQTGQPPVQPQFDFLGGADDITAGGVPGTSLNANFESGDPPVHYSYDPSTRTYLRFNGTRPHSTEDGQLAFRNIVIEVVNVTTGSYRDPAGNITHEINLVGSGRAIVLRGGRAFEGTWSRSSRSEPAKLKDASGNPLRLAPGHTIVELVPSGQPISFS
jgi:Protein of unknown function (DUF3048) N-terminal domain/Protein of unknown function (DUF3048) C-terminal domain